MTEKFQVIHTTTQDLRDKNSQWNMPYVPGIKILQGKPVYISGVNAAPIYHAHPHRSEEFDSLDFTVENQAKLTMENLRAILEASGGSFQDVAQIFIFIVDIKKNEERIGRVVSSYFGEHLPTSTVVGVSDLLTDDRLILEITAVAYI